MDPSEPELTLVGKNIKKYHGGQARSFSSSRSFSICSCGLPQHELDLSPAEMLPPLLPKELIFRVSGAFESEAGDYLNHCYIKLIWRRII